MKLLFAGDVARLMLLLLRGLSTDRILESIIILAFLGYILRVIISDLL